MNNYISGWRLETSFVDGIYLSGHYTDDCRDHDTCDIHEDCDTELEDTMDWDPMATNDGPRIGFGLVPLAETLARKDMYLCSRLPPIAYDATGYLVCPLCSRSQLEDQE